MQDNDPIQLTVAQSGQAGEVLARAFHEDPLYVLVMPEEGKRAKVLAWLFDKVAHYARLYGQAHTTPGLEGVACWLPPGHAELTLGRLVRSGLAATPLKLGLTGSLRFNTYMNYAEELHQRHAPKSHWYLWVVGVDPASQGRGIGSRLLEPVLARASADGTACYLETGVERNIPFYEKHGFRVVGEGRVPGLEVPVWALRREAPGPAGG